MRKQELRPGGEAGQGHAASSPAEQVKALVDLLAGKGGQSSQAPQPPNRTPECPLKPHGNDLRIQRHREALLSRTGGGPELGSPSPRLTSLLLVEGLTDLQLREHDFTQVEATRGGWCSAKTIALDRLFLPLSRVSIPPRISITIGVAGVGKTTLVRNFVHLWARGQVGKDFSLVLPLSFRDLNTHEKLSADRLLRSVFPHAGEAGLASAALSKALLVLDGLDECKTPLDFSNTMACTDPKKEIQVDHLITNIIRGNLFPEVSVWITSRPGAAGQIPGGLVDRMTEIRGFSEEEIKTCLEQMFPEDPVLTGWVLSQVQADRALYLMCTVPAFCRLAGAALGYLHRHRPGPPDAELWPPRTLCELYSWYFRMALGGEGQEKAKASPRIEQLAHSSRKLVGTLGRLAFHGLVRKKYVFYEPDLKVLGVDLALLQTALCGRFLQREETLASAAAYCFTHLSLQEFVAAAYYCSASKRAIFDLFTEGGVSWPRLGFLTHFRSAAQRAMQAEDGRLDVFLRFLSGLLSPRVNALLAGSLLTQGENQGYRAQVAELLQGCLRPDVAVCARAINVLHCLRELQHIELTRSVEGAVASGGLATLTSPPHRAALAYLLQVSDVCDPEAPLPLRLGPGVLQSLLPQLLYCRSLRLDTNQFQDPVMDLLGSVLSGKDCRIQRIRVLICLSGSGALFTSSSLLKWPAALSKRALGDFGQIPLCLRRVNIGVQGPLDHSSVCSGLAENQISNKGAKALARSLLVNRSLTTLDLRSNSIGPQGAKALADALKINRTLASLSLQSNRIRDDGARSMAEALAANRILCVLHGLPCPPPGDLPDPGIASALQKNSIGPVGTQQMADALKQNKSLKELMFSSNSIGDGGAKALAEALMVNQGLKSLDLRENSISPEGAQDLARALRTNSTLKSLDLTANLLHDQGAQAVAEAVRENHTLTSLHLQWNFIQAGAAKALGQALQLNMSLTSLDWLPSACRVESSLHLQENAIGDEGASAVASALKVNTALTALYLRGNTIEVAGAKALANALKVNSSLRRLK
ncbi:hypothetical protein FD754_012452 [Muntiacus muntjak]|uniref:NACHT domain-containing protein n=1 Tax=Muntiacus muntjak TaxID=9888 RepID=A0A5N3VGS7_MUNMU|nr:hypothetical protein FD754_012452 [Muntiacus muntjak]